VAMSLNGIPTASLQPSDRYRMSGDRRSCEGVGRVSGSLYRTRTQRRECIPFVRPQRLALIQNIGDSPAKQREVQRV